MRKHFLVTNIEWDTEMEPAEDCGLPTKILVLDIPLNVYQDEDELDNQLSELISDCFGFCHRGFEVKAISDLQLGTGGQLQDNKSCMCFVDYKIYSGAR